MPNSHRVRKGACPQKRTLLAVCCLASSPHVTKRTTDHCRSATELHSPAPLGMRTGMYFASDNTAGMAPEILDAIGRANTGYALGYGNDEWTTRVERRFAEIFE